MVVQSALATGPMLSLVLKWAAIPALTMVVGSAASLCVMVSPPATGWVGAPLRRLHTGRRGNAARAANSILGRPALGRNSAATLSPLPPSFLPPPQPSRIFVSAVQHAAAGIVMCAVSTELLPALALIKGSAA